MTITNFLFGIPFLDSSGEAGLQWCNSFLSTSRSSPFPVKTLTFSPGSMGPLHEEVIFDKKSALAPKDMLELKNSLREVLSFFFAISLMLKENPKNERGQFTSVKNWQMK